LPGTGPKDGCSPEAKVEIANRPEAGPEDAYMPAAGSVDAQSRKPGPRPTAVLRLRPRPPGTAEGGYEALPRSFSILQSSAFPRCAV
jgi:hypothetical protein